MLLVGCLIGTSLAIYHNEEAYFNYYEEDNAVATLNHFLNSDEHYNTVFIGSSRTHRHIVPLLFDSLSTSATRSYNLGTPGLFHFRSLELLNRVLMHSDSLRFVVLELSSLSKNGINYNSKPKLFATSLQQTLDALSMATTARHSMRSFLGYTYDYIKTFFYKYLGFGIRYQFEVAAGLHPRPAEHIKLAQEIAQRNGYMALDDALLLWESDALKQRNSEFIKSPAFSGGAREHGLVPDSTFALDGYSDRLIEYTSKLQEKGINLIFYVSPRTYTSQYLADQKERLKNYAPIIDLSSSQKYPTFYSEEYSFDRGHLNNKGARLMTVEFANLFNQYFSEPHRSPRYSYSVLPR